MCGKGVDQTMRTAQRWAVLAPEIKESHCMGNEDNVGFDLEKSFFTNLITFDIWGALARPVLPIMKPVEKEDGRYTSGSLGVFDILSNELVDLVVASVSDLSENDLVALGLTCQRLWELIVHRVQKNYIKKAAPWAGRKIALQGSWSTSLPDSFNENGLAAKIVDDNEYQVNKHVARCLFCFMETKGAAPKATKTREASLMNAMDEHLPKSNVPARRWKDMWEQLKCPDLFPSDLEWVLRNLTTKEYVSESFNVGVIRVTKLRLVDALLLQVCWSDIPSGSGRFAEISQGDWAGHCFDIVTKEALADEEGSEAWKDVTDDVVKKAGRLRGDLHRHAQRW